VARGTLFIGGTVLSNFTGVKGYGLELFQNLRNDIKLSVAAQVVHLALPEIIYSLSLDSSASLHFKQIGIR
jgi:hypothetical protein